MGRPYSVSTWLYHHDGSFQIAIAGGDWQYRRWLAFQSVDQLEDLINRLWDVYKAHLSDRPGVSFGVVVKSRWVDFANVEALDHLIEALRRECKSLMQAAARRGTAQAA